MAALDVSDRWKGTPLDDAEREGQEHVAAYLISRGAPRGYRARGGSLARRSRGSLTDLPEEPDDVEELDDVDVQVRVTEAWLAALRERKYVEKFDADAEDDASDAAMPLFKAGVPSDAVDFDVDSWEYDVIALHERTHPAEPVRCSRTQSERRILGRGRRGRLLQCNTHCERYNWLLRMARIR